MKNQTRTFAIATGIAALIGGTLLTAQTPYKAVGNVPFAFHAGLATLPAGKYMVARVDGKGMLQMQNTETGRAVIVMANIPKQQNTIDQSKLVFNCYSGQCFLAEMWFQGETTAHTVKTSSREKELRAGNTKPELTLVAMR